MDSTLINYLAVWQRQPHLTFTYQGREYDGYKGEPADVVKKAQAVVDREWKLVYNQGQGVADLAPLGRALLALDAAKDLLTAYTAAGSAFYASTGYVSWKADAAAASAAVETAARAAAA